MDTNNSKEAYHRLLQVAESLKGLSQAVDAVVNNGAGDLNQNTSFFEMTRLNISDCADQIGEICQEMEAM